MHLHGIEAVIMVITMVGIRVRVGIIMHVAGIMVTKQVGMEEECRQDVLKKDTGKKYTDYIQMYPWFRSII
jgi:hypothetical protein